MHEYDFAAASEYKVEARVLASLQETFPSLDWEKLAIKNAKAAIEPAITAIEAALTTVEQAEDALGGRHGGV